MSMVLVCAMVLLTWWLTISKSLLVMMHDGCRCGATLANHHLRIIASYTHSMLCCDVSAHLNRLQPMIRWRNLLHEEIRFCTGQGLSAQSCTQRSAAVAVSCSLSPYNAVQS